MASAACVVGTSWLTVPEDVDQQLDEMVFDVTSSALRTAGLRRHQVGLSIISSLDIHDGRSISNALTAPAAAGYLGDELRVEGDALAAAYMALASILSRRVDAAVVVGLHVPEIGSIRECDVRGLREKASNYTFNAHLDRPVGMTSEVTLGIHAEERLAAGEERIEDMALSAACDITLGATRGGTRAPVTSQEVLDSPLVSGPLTELMLPASAAGLGVVVLATDILPRRLPSPMARILGWGMATMPATSNPLWLEDPGRATAKAASDAYHRAGIRRPEEAIHAVEMTDLTPALTHEMLRALQLPSTGLKVNAAGGVRSNHPGNANGLLRLVQGVEALDVAKPGNRCVVHAVDDMQGLVSSTATVMLLEVM